MTMFEVLVSSGRLYNGRRSFFLAVTLLGRRWYLQRWDTARAPRNRFRSGPMGWTWGRI